MRIAIRIIDYNEGRDLATWHVSKGDWIYEFGDLLAVKGKPYYLIGSANRSKTFYVVPYASV